MTETSNDKIPVAAPPNPVQREALFKIKKGPVLYVADHPSQGLLLCWNLIRQRLKAGEKVQIISPDESWTRQLDLLLRSNGLASLSCSYLDTPGDIRDKLTSRKKIPKPDAYKKLPWQQWKRRMIDGYQYSQRILFGERTYRNLAQEWFRAMQGGSPEILEARLDPSLFQFSPQEFYQLRGRVKEAEALFNPQVARLHALEKLDERFFTEMTAEEAEAWLYDHLDEAILRTRELLKRLHAILASYKKHIQCQRFDLYAHYLERLEEVRDRIEAANLEYGDELLSPSSGLQGKLRHSFSGRSKELDQVKKQLKLAYMELHRELQESPFAPFIQPFEDLSIPSIAQLLSEQKKKLEGGWPILLLRAQESQVRLNSQNLEGNEEQTLVIRDLEKQIEEWLKELNALRFFGKPIDENALSLPKKGEILGHILDILEETMAQLPRFIPFHEWMSFSLKLNGPARKLILLLGEEQNGDWQSSFEAWYYSQLLARHQHPLVPQAEKLPEWWHGKQQTEQLEWIQEFGALDPDGGWLTRLNLRPEDQALSELEEDEWLRLFPVCIHKKSSPSSDQDNQKDRIILTPGDHMQTVKASFSKAALIISDASFQEELPEFQRLFDPRALWPGHQGVLKIKSADKIGGIKALSEALIFDIAPARLIQSRDLLLISRWPANVEDALLRKLDRNMKSQDLDHEEDTLSLVEGLLDNDRSLFLLIEDQLLNRTDPVWESLVLGWCREAGLQVISLDWQALWKNEHDWLEQVVSRMKLNAGT